METWTILLLIYLVSAIICRWQIQYMYKNIWTSISPDFTDIVIVFLPIANTMVTLFTFGCVISNTTRGKTFVKKFFGIR